MRVAFLMEQCLAPVPGGTGRYSTETVAALADRGGTDLTGWTAWHRDVRPAAVGGVRGPRRLPLPRRPLTLAWERGRGPVPGGGPDLVHAPTLLAPPRGRRPLVVTVHDAVPWSHPETLTPRGVRWHRTMAERVAATADLVVVPTAAVRAELARHVDLRRVEVVPGGVSSAATTVPPDAARRAARLGVPTSGHLVSLATVEPRKGLDVLLDSLALPGAPDLPLLVVGQPGWGGVDVLAEAARRGLPDGRVRLLGRLTDEDLAVVLSTATALVVPSRAEGFGLPVVEGMALGVPVVVSDAPALVEVGGDAVRVTPVGDPSALAGVLAEVAADPVAREEMRRAGRARAAVFRWSVSADRLVDLYAEVA